VSFYLSELPSCCQVWRCHLSPVGLGGLRFFSSLLQIG